MKINQKGQALIELSISFSAMLLILIPGILIFFHILYLKQTAQYLLYDYLICQETRLIIIPCDFKLKQKLNSTLFGARFISITNNKTEKELQSQLTLLTSYQKRIIIHEQIKIPIQ